MKRLLSIVTLGALLCGCAAPPTAIPERSLQAETKPTQEATALLVTVISSTDTEQPVSTPTVATTTPILIPTDTTSSATESDTEETSDWLSTVTIEDGLYVLGNPNAPIRLIDYSDFL